MICGCSVQTIEKSQPNAITGKAIEKINEPVSDNAQNITKKEDKASELPDVYYDADKLIADLNKTFNASYYNFTRDETNPDYITSSDLKYYVIHTTGSRHITNFREFCRYYCGSNWDGFKFYLNMSAFNTYILPLDKSNFSLENEYNYYILNRVLVNYTRKEKVYELENGKILEYKFWFLEQDEHENFEGNLMPYLLIYKIYCSPNLTIFIRPKWERFSVRSPGKVTETIVNWELEDDRVREELLNKTNEILEACPVEKEFFDDYEIDPYFESELRVWYWKTYYTYQFNLTPKISITAQKTSKDSDEYWLKGINISFTNNDVYDIYYLKLKITVSPDGKSERNYYQGEGTINILSPGSSINRSIKKDEIEFKNNITITSTLYTEEESVPIRPLRITFTKEDLGLA